MATRNSKAKIEYLSADGVATKLTDADNIAHISFKFSDGRSHSIDLAQVPTHIARVATVRGLAEKIRDTYAGSEDLDDAFDECSDMVSRLVAGEWMSAREGGGPGISTFIEAVKAVKGAAFTKLGQVYDPAADEPVLREKYVGRDKGKARSAALAGNASLRAEYDRLLAEVAQRKATRASERAAKSAGAAAGDVAAAASI